MALIYFNYTNEPIIGEIYANLHTVNQEEVTHIAELLQVGNNDIYLPPNEETTIERVYSFNEIKQMHDYIPEDVEAIYIFQLLSHAHQLMQRFDVEIYDGETGNIEMVYSALDYLHPPIITYNDPLEMNQGDYMRLTATYNNTTDDVVEFGLLSVDEMMIIFGYFYYD